MTILSELLADEAQYFSTDPSLGEDNGNLNSSNLMTTSTDSTGNYSSEFNGFAELITPKSIKSEYQAECAFTPSENYASYTDISYNTKPCSRLSTEINDAFVKCEPEIDIDDGQRASTQFEKSTDENLPQQLPNTEIIKQETQDVGSIESSTYTRLSREPVEFQQQNTISDYGRCNSMQNMSHQPLISPIPPIISLPKSNGITETGKSDRLTSSLRLIRKPNFRQFSFSSHLIKTKKLSIRLDRSIVDDFLSKQRKQIVRNLQPIVLLKRLELVEEENSVKRSKVSRIGKRKQNRAIWDGETVKDKKVFKRRRDDTDDAEGSSGFTGGSSGGYYSSDSQSGTSSGDSVDSPPPKSTNGGGASDSTEQKSKLNSCKQFKAFLFCIDKIILSKKSDTEY